MKKNRFLNILLYTFIFVLIITAVFIFSYFIGCPIRLITNIPCPACGLTRAYISFFQGDFNLAFYYHPLFFLLPAALLCVFYLLYIEKKPSPKARLPAIIISILLIVTFVTVYLIRLFYGIIP